MQVSKLSYSSAKAWHVAPSTLYLHPEYLAPPQSYAYHRCRHSQPHLATTGPSSLWL